MAKKPGKIVVDYDGKKPSGRLVDGARELMDDFERDKADAGIWWTAAELKKRQAGKA